MAVAALLVAIGGAAYAAIPDSDGTIHACYQKQNGTVRVVESDQSCRASEAALDWNQRGPAGPPGPPGPGSDAEVLTEGGTVANGEIITFLEVPGMVRLTLQCPDNFAGGQTHYNYTAENLDLDEPLFVDTSPLFWPRLEPGASLELPTTTRHEKTEFGVFGGARVVNGVMRLHRSPIDTAPDRDCVFASQAVLSSVE